MTVNTKVEVAGIKQAVRSLNKIEPGLRKQFTADVTQIVQPAIDETQRAYAATGLPLSGMARAWAGGWRSRGPFSSDKAKAGVKVQLLNDRRFTAAILVVQSNPAGAIFESAGRRSQNALSASLDDVSGQRGFRRIQKGRTRILGPSVYRKTRSIERELEQAAIKVTNRVNKELN